MRAPVAIRRLAFRTAYALLRVYWFVRRPQKRGVKCVLRGNERVLLVRHTYGPDEWDLPGGALKRNEPPTDAAQREMHEELGIQIEDWTSLGEMFGRADHRRDRLYCFQAEIGEAQLTIDLGELEEARWFGRAELPPRLGKYVRPILARSRP